MHWFEFWKIKTKADIFSAFLRIMFFFSVAGIYMFFVHLKKGASEKGHIIILNGASASGKTTVQKLLQAHSANMYITIGIDNFFDALLPAPDLTEFEKTKTLQQFTHDGILIRSVTQERDEDGNVLVPLKIGPAGQKVIYGMHKAIAAYASCGNNIIVDYILYDVRWVEYLKFYLKDYTVYMIGFKLPLEAIEEREKARKTSPVGHARSHYFSVHNGMQYDLEFSDPAISAEKIAHAIIEFVKDEKKPAAFLKMLKS